MALTFSSCCIILFSAPCHHIYSMLGIACNEAPIPAPFKPLGRLGVSLQASSDDPSDRCGCQMMIRSWQVAAFPRANDAELRAYSEESPHKAHQSVFWVILVLGVLRRIDIFSTVCPYRILAMKFLSLFCSLSHTHTRTHTRTPSACVCA